MWRGLADRSPPEFPGCRPVRISRAEIRTWEGRIEFWDADTEIAMAHEPAAAIQAALTCNNEEDFLLRPRIRDSA